jgi:hypothetical protein
MKLSIKSILLMQFLAILCACSLKIKDQTGVTSTGNSGEIAGVVYDASSQALARQTLQASAPKVIYSATVILRSASGVPLDSMQSNRDGTFWFRDLTDGVYQLSVFWEMDSTELRSIHLDQNELFQAQLVLVGQSGPLENSGRSISLYSSEPGLVEQSYWLDYIYDSTTQNLKIKRPVGETFTEGSWITTFSNMDLALRNTSQNGCVQNGHFFSTLSNQIHGNNWYYNGDLLLDYPLGSSSRCQEPLIGLPEMNQMGMDGLLLQFDSTHVRARFASNDWCFTRDADWTRLSVAHLSIGSFEIVNCNTFRLIKSTADTISIRILWIDLGAGTISEEVSTGKNSCIYTGTMDKLSASECF